MPLPGLGSGLRVVLRLSHMRSSAGYSFCRVYGRNAENEPVSRLKMADYRAVVSMGTL